MSPKFSIIIIGKNLSDCQESISTVLKLNNRNFNLFVSIGNNPSAQRNAASKIVTGEYLLFLDNDSQVSPDLLDRYNEVINNFEPSDIIGGPAIYLSSDTYIKNSAKIISASAFGFAFSKARYTPIGEIRESHENELILCNLCIKKQFFLNYHGFRTDLYPNEENEFINRVQRKGKTYYHPLAIVKRGSIGSLSEFNLKLFTYGSGRAKHYYKHPSHFKSIYLIPSIFSFYVLTLPISLGFSKFTIIPFIIYFLLAIMSSTFNCLGKSKRSICLTSMMFFLGHFMYGLGYISYLFSPKRRDEFESSVEVIEIPT
jgi:GT2 family glycosyltransferase